MEVEDDKSNICPNFLNGNCREIATCKWLHPGEVSSAHVQPNKTRIIVYSDGAPNEELTDCLALLEKLMDQDIALPFNTPVDHKALGLLDYPRIIKKPCDLGTIKELLLAGSIVNTMHFNVHVRLVFDNAILFNTDESQITVLAKKLKAQFEQMFEEMLERWKQEVAEHDKQSPEDLDKEKEREKKQLQLELDSLTNNIDKLKQELHEVRKRKGQVVNNTLLNGNVKRVKLTRPKAPLTVKQKEELVHKIQTELDPDDYPALINIADPHAEGDEEFQLNLSILDEMTILNIHKYVSDCIKSRNRKSRRPKKKKDDYSY